MVISVSLVILVGIILVLMVRNGKISWGPALVAALFGFLLASSDLAPNIQDFLDSVSRSISEIDL
ncbi:hypothetical protein ABZ553_21105 [Streptomyces sparsogenes]|uniref:Uncharacterized protein n=1 Tax=Streptomyces sparsogenes DSM 40356 TaxID=1331668 RepID=A0A1R1SJ84_9ACTN|nr:hypothetical protein [Streptomyces sparsogenes]OMI38351.1 hypothetical protein SPAR_16392 [Streptomyces sparsogenes DSM 40356]